MAIASWATVTPNSGSGNGSTAWTGTKNTARHQTRQFDAYYTAGNITRTCHVIQAGADLFITGTNPSMTSDSQGGGTSLYNVSNAGGNLTIQGLTANGGGTNASKIKYELQSATGHSITGSLNLTLPANYTANGNSTANNGAITGDPGTQGAFDFSIPVTIPANATLDVLGCTVHITAYGDSASETATWDIVIVQAAAEPYLYIGKDGQVTDETVNLTADGTPAVNVPVFSNTSWTVS